jgi:cation/acetate symporter
LALGIFWRRANKTGAIVGMVGGLGVCMFYMFITYPFFGVNAPLWWDINPISAGIFGMIVGFVGVIAGSLLSPAPGKEVQTLVDQVRYPNLEGDINTKVA